MPTEPTTLADALSALDDRLETDALASPAAPSADKPLAADVQQYVLFDVASTTYAVPQALVTELDRVPKLTLVPHVPAWVRGVCNLRGDVLSLIDVRGFLGLDFTSPYTGQMLVVRLLDEDFSVGLLVDRVDRIAGIPRDDIRPSASPLEGALATYLAGVWSLDGRLVAVLNLDRWLRSPEIRQFDVREIS
jgi:purine-binding chemotaxis protein CheW